MRKFTSLEHSTWFSIIKCGWMIASWCTGNNQHAVILKICNTTSANLVSLYIIVSVLSILAREENHGFECPGEFLITQGYQDLCCVLFERIILLTSSDIKMFSTILNLGGYRRKFDYWLRGHLHPWSTPPGFLSSNTDGWLLRDALETISTLWSSRSAILQVQTLFSDISLFLYCRF